MTDFQTEDKNRFPIKENKQEARHENQLLKKAKEREIKKIWVLVFMTTVDKVQYIYSRLPNYWPKIESK